MRKALLGILAGFAMGAPIQALSAADSPDLSIRFVNAIPDICFRTARGHAPTIVNAAALMLEPAANVPAMVKAHFFKVTSWFRLKSAPDNIFVGIGDRTNCHLILANSARTREVVQEKVGAILKIGGFQTLAASAPSASVTDMLFAKEAPDGYMLVSLQAPRDTVRGGEGEQGAVHVSLMPKAMFESMLKH